MWVSGFRVQGSGCRVQGSRCREPAGERLEVDEEAPCDLHLVATVHGA